MVTEKEQTKPLQNFKLLYKTDICRKYQFPDSEELYKTILWLFIEVAFYSLIYCSPGLGLRAVLSCLVDLYEHLKAIHFPT